MESREKAERLMRTILDEGGRLSVEGEVLICGPRKIAMSHAAEIRDLKSDLIALLSEPAPKTFRQQALELIQSGLCPDCQYRLDLQSRTDGNLWWCPACRIHLKESDFHAPAIAADN